MYIHPKTSAEISPHFKFQDANPDLRPSRPINLQRSKTTVGQTLSSINYKASAMQVVTLIIIIGILANISKNEGCPSDQKSKDQFYIFGKFSLRSVKKETGLHVHTFPRPLLQLVTRSLKRLDPYLLFNKTGTLDPSKTKTWILFNEVLKSYDLKQSNSTQKNRIKSFFGNFLEFATNLSWAKAATTGKFKSQGYKMCLWT